MYRRKPSGNWPERGKSIVYDKKQIAEKLKRWEAYLSRYTLPAWEELPGMPLYMEQVVCFLTKTLEFLPKEEGGSSVVTPVAINNYVRMRIMPPPQRKKYGRVHLAYLIMICTLKQSLAISYIQKILPPDLPEEILQVQYNDYVEKHRRVSRHCIGQMQFAAQDVLDPLCTNENAVSNLVTAAAIFSGFSNLLAVKLLDLLETQPEPGAEANQETCRKAPEGEEAD